MTSQRAIILLSQMYIPAFDEEEKDAITKAIEALNAQEPRVMTLEELEAIGPIWEYDTPPYLWLDTNPSLRNTVGYWCAWTIIHDLLEGQNVTYTVENYGTGWRCWTSRPTDAQMEATPWP